MQHAAHWSALDGAMGYVCSMLHTGVHLMRLWLCMQHAARWSALDEAMGYVCSMLHAGVHLMRLWVMYAACCTLECT